MITKSPGGHLKLARGLEVHLVKFFSKHKHVVRFHDAGNLNYDELIVVTGKDNLNDDVD